MFMHILMNWKKKMHYNLARFLSFQLMRKVLYGNRCAELNCSDADRWAEVSD